MGRKRAVSLRISRRFHSSHLSSPLTLRVHRSHTPTCLRDIDTYFVWLILRTRCISKPWSAKTQFLRTKSLLLLTTCSGEHRARHRKEKWVFRKDFFRLLGFMFYGDWFLVGGWPLYQGKCPRYNPEVHRILLLTR